jgi:hypothetical protein
VNISILISTNTSAVFVTLEINNFERLSISDSK